MPVAEPGSPASAGGASPDLIASRPAAPMIVGAVGGEPLRTPGSIQPNGALVAVDDDLVVRHVSANIGTWFGVPPDDALGSSLERVVGPATADALGPLLASDEIGEITFVHGGRMLLARCFRTAGVVIVELEEADGETMFTGLRMATVELNRAETVVEALDVATRMVRRLSGFDRVMAYRLGAELTGQVIAEDRRDDLETFLGLHYPASELPASARELLLRDPVQVVPDLSYEPVPILPPTAADGRPLDLSDSVLRSVSEAGVRHLRDIGVTAAMTIALLVGGELWGVIVGHHVAGPHRPPPGARGAAHYVAQIAALRIDELDRRAEQTRADARAQIAARLGDSLASAPKVRISAVLRAHAVDLLDIADAAGVLIRFGEDHIVIGSVPPPEAVDRLLGHWPDGAEYFSTDHAVSIEPEWEPYAATAAGVLAMGVSTDRQDVAVWFRSERIESVDWGRDPGSGVDGVSLDGTERWRETVRGRSAPWDTAVVNAIFRLTRHVSGARLARDRSLRVLAQHLQQAMLPSELPQVDGLSVDGFLVADGLGRIGGDWYDVVGLGERTAIIVGDVSGHGLGAASTMTQARNSLRAFLSDGASAADAIAKLDHLVRSTLPGEMLTVVVAILDHDTHDVDLCSAGHLPALRIHDGAGVFADAPTNRPVGVTDEAFHAGSFVLADGELLLLYTDGLVEDRRRSIDVGLEELRTAACAIADEPIAGLAKRLVHELTPVEHADDVTLLIVRADGPASGRERRARAVSAST